MPRSIGVFSMVLYVPFDWFVRTCHRLCEDLDSEAMPWFSESRPQGITAWIACPMSCATCGQASPSWKIGRLGHEIMTHALPILYRQLWSWPRPRNIRLWQSVCLFWSDCQMAQGYLRRDRWRFVWFRRFRFCIYIRLCISPQYVQHLTRWFLISRWMKSPSTPIPVNPKAKACFKILYRFDESVQ